MGFAVSEKWVIGLNMGQLWNLNGLYKCSHDNFISTRNVYQPTIWKLFFLRFSKGWGRLNLVVFNKEIKKKELEGGWRKEGKFKVLDDKLIRNINGLHFFYIAMLKI